MIGFEDLDFTLADLHALGATRARHLATAMMIAAKRLAKYADLLARPSGIERPRQCRACFRPFAIAAREADLERAGEPQRAHCRRCIARRRAAGTDRRGVAQHPTGGVLCGTRS